MEFFNAFVSFFQEGGFYMYPIAITFAIGLAIGLERYLALTAITVTNASAYNKLMPLMKNKDLEKLKQAASKADNAMGRIFLAGITHAGLGQRRDDAENSMEERVLEARPRIQARSSYIYLAASICPLLGLLGTVFGMIGAFEVVADADAAEKAKLLPAMISIAMNTTAFGIIAAIPLMVLHEVVIRKTQKIINSLDTAVVAIANILHGMNKAPARKPEAPKT